MVFRSTSQGPTIRAMGRGVVIAVFLLLAVLPASTAFAHAEPAKVKPGDGAVLTTAPTTYEITMTQELARQPGANEILILDTSGRQVTAVNAVIDNSDRRKLSVAMPTNLAPGVYQVQWRSLSADDGDPARGTLSFTYDPNGTASAGRESLKETASTNNSVTPTGNSGAQRTTTESSDGLGISNPGTTWVTTIAIGAMMFVVGAGATYAFVNRKT